jgi:hypothetical protein
MSYPPLQEPFKIDEQGKIISLPWIRWIDEVGKVQSLPPTVVDYNPIDNSGATGDRLLKAGEVAYINYTSVTSLALHIQTVEGLYEMDVLGDITSAAINTNANAQWKPNNANDTGQFSYNLQGGGGSYNNFLITIGRISNANIRISTFTNNKSINLVSGFRDTGSAIGVYNGSGWWKNTTPWTSLGTITFPFAQSGKIVIRRII